MRKIFTVLAITLLWTSTALAQESRAQATASMMALGMPAALADEVASLATGTAVMPNNSYALARNAADSANINVWKVNATDETVLNADTGDSIEFAVAGTSFARANATAIGPIAAGGIDLGTAALPFGIVHAGDATRVMKMGDDDSVGYVGTFTNQNMELYSNSLARWAVANNGQLINNATNGGDAVLTKTGTTLSIQEATAGSACSGTLTANGATPVVTSTSCALTGSRIFLSRTSAETGTVSAWISALSTGVSFSITSEAADTGTYNWVIFHEAA